MPNRILKESICTSEKINRLTWFEECTFIHLIANCDDYGRMDARPAVLKARLFPLKDSVTNKSVEQAIHSLVRVGLVKVYMYDQQPFLCLSGWAKHQQIRNQKSKYPSPDDSDSREFDCNCDQLIADDRKCPRNPIQSESNPNRESNPNSRARARESVRYADDPALDAAIRDFVADRKARKASMTDRAIVLLVKKLDALAGDDATKIAILEQSIANGWKGIFPLKTEYATQQHSSPKTPSEIANDLMRLYVDEEAEGGIPT